MIHRNTKVIVVLSLLFLAACAIVSVIFGQAIRERKETYEQLHTERIAMLEREASLGALSEALDNTKEERESLETRILADDDVISFLALIEMIGREQGVQLTTSALNVGPLDASFEELILTIEVRGGYAAVTQTLAIFEHLPYQSSVAKLNLAEEGSSAIWRAAFEVRVTKFKKV